ncbi:MAG: insulinase family protein [Betaproteobacteria bacterium]|nr:insulinase family protein [Betaproteobacteria bacterium]
MSIEFFAAVAGGRWRALLMSVPLVFAAASAVAQTHEHKLANGLRVIVKEDHRAPTVVSMVWYKAGSMDEFNGTTGVAHVLEHMMFKGTKEVPGGEFSKIIAAAGGRDNAFTSKDYTAYFQQLHKSQLPLSFRLEADRMANLVLTPEEFAKEIKVVMEERRLRTDDRPQSLVYEQLMANALTAHPYRAPIIGWMNDLENMAWHDARQWYERWYAPNNAIVVVVGDVDPQEVFALADKYFRKLKPKALPERKPQDEPGQRGIRRVTVKAPAELPYLLMGYRAPALRDPEKDWEPYALEMLAGVLDGHEAARLTTSLVRGEKIANAVDAGYDGTSRGPGMFVVSGVPIAGRTAAELEHALRRELAKIVNDGVSEEELKRVKAQVVAAQVFQRDSMFFQARQIGSLETAGYSYKTIDLMLRKLQEVTAAQVQEVAKKYLVDDGLTIAVLDPQPLAGRKPAAAPQGPRHAQ